MHIYLYTAYAGASVGWIDAKRSLRASQQTLAFTFNKRHEPIMNDTSSQTTTVKFNTWRTENLLLHPKMPQNILAEVFRYYHIIAPKIHNTADPNHNLLQELECHIPQGIPALYAFSERHVEDHGPGKELMKVFIERHGGRLPDLRLLPLACVLIYLPRMLQDTKAALLNQRLHSTFEKRSLAEVVIVRFAKSPRGEFRSKRATIIAKSLGWKFRPSRIVLGGVPTWQIASPREGQW